MMDAGGKLRKERKLKGTEAGVGKGGTAEKKRKVRRYA